jgi:hypothetical protein
MLTHSAAASRDAGPLGGLACVDCVVAMTGLIEFEQDPSKAILRGQLCVRLS